MTSTGHINLGFTSVTTDKDPADDDAAQQRHIYLERAEDARRSGEQSDDPKAKSLFFRLADLWTKLARRQKNSVIAIGVSIAITCYLFPCSL